MNKGTCSIADCGRPAHTRGWCRTHYGRWLRGASLHMPIRAWRVEDRSCAADGCTRPFHSTIDDQSWCSMHASRVNRHGDPGAWKRRGVDHGMWAGEKVGYHGVHRRLYKEYGQARSHRCADCGGQAEQWSYDGADPKERSDPRRGPFSADLDRYQPRCVPCHRKLDLAALTSRGWTVWNKGPDTCSETHCDRKAHARGLCSTHYSRWYVTERKKRSKK